LTKTARGYDARFCVWTPEGTLDAELKHTVSLRIGCEGGRCE
jgi:hypothetical protein